jgi:hypothetical protein
MQKSILALALLLLTPPLSAAPHSATLTWTASVDMPATIPPGSGYNIYRLNAACPASVTSLVGWTQVNMVPVTVNTYTDSTLTPGQWCYSAVTVLNGGISNPSNTAAAPLAPAAPTSVTVTSEQ